MRRSDPSTCAQNGTVVVTTAAPSNLARIVALAADVRMVGFGCLVVEALSATPMQGWPQEVPGALMLASPDAPLLPRARWCNNSQYDFRRTQLSRQRAWRLLLSHGLDILGVDPSTRLLRNPLPVITAQRTAKGPPPDVLGKAPGWFLKEYVLSGIWIRSTVTTRALLERVEARTWGAWDQLIFSEELNWGAGRGAACCHTNCLSATMSVKAAPKGPARLARECLSSEATPPGAPAPPNGTRNNWRTPWRVGDYNSLPIPHHRFGPCTGRAVTCAARPAGACT